MRKSEEKLHACVGKKTFKKFQKKLMLKCKAPKFRSTEAGLAISFLIPKTTQT